MSRGGVAVGRRHGRWLGLILLGFVVAFLGLWFGPSPPAVRVPVRLVRNADGRLVQEPAENRSGLNFEVQAGKLEAQNSLTSSSSASNSDVSRFAGRRLLILGFSDHPLMQRVAGQLLEQLKSLQGVSQIDYRPLGYHAEAGSRAPDVFITLDLEKITESGWLSQELDATVVMTAGTSPVSSHHVLIDQLTPPTLNFSWQASLHHQSKRTGVGSSAAKYKLQSEDIAKQLAQSLIKQIDEWRKKYGELTELPAEVYAKYHEPPELPLEGYSAEQVASHSGFWLHNETTWRCRDGRDLAEVFPEIQARLQAGGWTTVEMSTKAPMRLAMKKEDVQVEVLLSPRKLEGRQDHYTFYVQSRERISVEERDAALAKMLERETPIETLLLFERHWNAEQRARLLALLEKEPIGTAQKWLTIAKLQHSTANDAAAKTSLQKAQALLFTVRDWPELAQGAKTLAKTLGDEKLLESPPDGALLRGMGFVQWPSQSAEAAADGGVTLPDKQRFDVDTPLLLFHLDDAGKLYKYCLRVAKDAGVENPAVECIVASPGVQSWSSGMPIGENRSAMFNWSLPGQAVRVHVSRVAGEPALEATFTIERADKNGSANTPAVSDSI